MTTDASFGRWLKHRRQALGLTQEALAERVGCAAETLRKLEANARRPSLEIASRLADAVHIAPGERDAFVQWARLPLGAARPAAPPATSLLASLPTPPQLATTVSVPLTPLIGRAAEVATERTDHVAVDRFAEVLTLREREILRCLAQGRSNQEIADQLHLSLKTIKWYNSQIFDKLGVKNRGEAMRAVAAARTKPASERPSISLPTQLTPLVGRSVELADLVSRLRAPDVRLLTLLAPGGMGKTRLAIETAARSADVFADGVVFVSLAQVETPIGLVLAVADALNVPITSACEPKQQLFAFVRDQSLLLILDNFEQLVDQAPFVTELIEHAPRLKVLVTSREKLQLTGETVYTLGGLAVPTSTADCLSCGAIQLFLEHARRASRPFVPDDHASLVRIAQLTQGMPLALLLAAAWADILAPAQIADEISRGINVLHQELRDAPPRHRSIRAVCDSTWAGLAEQQRQVFMRLCVFQGGFTLESAQAVAGVDLPMLASLSRKSLVQPLADRRYTIHPLLRQYGAEHLSRTEAVQATHAAHSSYFLDFLAQREADVKGRRQADALAEIDTEWENISTAWRLALTHRNYTGLDRALECLALGGEMTGRLLETRALLDESTERLKAYGHVLWERVAVRLARCDVALRDDRSLAVVPTICRHARERGDARELAWCLRVLGDQEAIFNASDQRALPLYEELIDLCRAVGNEYLLAHGLTYIAWRYANGGRMEHAVAALREALAVRRHIGDVKDLAHVTAQFSWMTFDLLDDADAAEALLDEQITLQQRLTAPAFLPGLLGIKALLACCRGDFDIACELGQRGVALSRNQNYLGGTSVCQGVLGMVENVNGNYAAARARCQEVLASNTVAQTAFLQLWGLALAHYGLGAAASGHRCLVAALQIARRFRSPTFQGLCLLLAAVAVLRQSDPPRAAAYLAFGFAQPVSRSGWLHRWGWLADVRTELHEHIGAAASSAAWEQGRAMDVNSEAARLLAALQQLV